MSTHTRQCRLGRLVATALLAAGLWSSTVAAVAAAERAEAKGDATPVPIPVTAAVMPTGLDAATPLPGGSVPWTAVAAPPALGEAGGLLLQGGGGAPQLRYYALDALGSVRVVFDAAGAVVSRADYEPFGAAVPASTTGTLPRQQFTGQERDGEVGVDYFGARMYVPQLGRMASVDPIYSGAIKNPQRWNRYAHVLNNPLGYLDPDGRQIVCSSETSCSDSVTVSGTAGSASLHGALTGGMDRNGPAKEEMDIGDRTGGLILEAVHFMLDVVGLVSATGGDLADLANAALYASRGDAENALTSLSAATPVFGASGTIAKWTRKAAKGGAQSAENAVRLSRQLTAQEIAGGHAFGKHAGEFAELGIKSRQQFARHIESIMNNPSATRELSNGRTAFWDNATGTVVIRNPSSVDGGTAFRPTAGMSYFTDILK